MQITVSSVTDSLAQLQLSFCMCQEGSAFALFHKNCLYVKHISAEVCNFGL